MSELLKLKEILGEARLRDITTGETSDHNSGSHDNTLSNLSNAKEIYCECKTLILRPNHARLIIPSESMLATEKNLKLLQHSDESFKNMVHGCYWLVDDMYKFEQMGYTKEISPIIDKKPTQSDETSSNPDENQSQTQVRTNEDEIPNTKAGLVTEGLRFLACAECNVCPLGWFDPKTKESYLYVW